MICARPFTDFYVALIPAGPLDYKVRRCVGWALDFESVFPSEALWFTTSVICVVSCCFLRVEAFNTSHGLS